jgi:hypothetical protein
VRLKTSPGNVDGSLLSADEYQRQRAEFLKEKTSLEELLADAGQQVNQLMNLAEETFKFACSVRDRFAKGDPKTKKGILVTIGSNLILRDKIISIEAKKPYLILENSLMDEKAKNESIEPENTKPPQRHKEGKLSENLRRLGDLDDVRTYGYKAERAAALIYAHFKKEFGGSVDR